MRLIDADALVAQWEESMKKMEEPVSIMFTNAAINDVKEAPTIEAVKPAKWWRYPLHQLGFPNHIFMMYMCSECKHKVEYKTPYCPWCGAKMDDQEQDTKFVYCKDCRYNNGDRCAWHGGAGYKWLVDDDDYCSVGERR